MSTTLDVTAPVPRAVLQARIDHLQRWMSTEEYDALVVFSAGSNLGTTTRSHGHLRYLLDWGGDVAPSAAVVTRTGLPSLVVTNVFLQLLAQEQAWLPVRLGRGAQFAAAISQFLPQGATRIGIVGRDEMPTSLWESIIGLAPGGWIDCTHALERRRLIKDDVQIAYHRRAASICDEMFSALGRELHTGNAVFQVQAELEHVGRDRGCEYAQTWLTVGPVVDRPRYWRHENTHVPQPGDQVALGIMVQYQGHWAHAIRTGALGEPTAAARRIFEVVERMYTAMIADLRTGRDLNGVNDAAEAIVTDHLAQTNQPPHFRFRNGHALGHSYEDPIVSAPFAQPYDAVKALRALPIPAQAGMLFEIHPNLFIPAVAGASLGDTVLVSETGPEVLTQYPQGLARF